MPSPPPTEPASGVAWKLDLLFALSFVAAGLFWLERAADPRFGDIQLLIFAAALLVCLASWLTVRLGSPGRTVDTAEVVFELASVGVVFAGDGPFALPMFLMTLLLVVPRHGSWVGLKLVLTMGVIQLGLMLILERGWMVALTQTALTLLILTFGLVLAAVVAEHQRQRSRIATLLVDTRRGFAAEKELVLADERARAAREMHDGLGRDLTLIQLSLRFAERARENDPDAAWQEVTTARERAGESLEQMRRWVRALHPARTSTAGGVDALRAVADGFAGTGLEVRVESDGADSAPNQEVALFQHRFVQEGLTNVLRHVGATSVVVRHRVQDGRLELAVIDRGGQRQESVTEGFGLRSLRERAQAIGGDVHTQGHEDGFTLSAQVPLEGET